jgi:hypothetical protein
MWCLKSSRNRSRLPPPGGSTIVARMHTPGRPAETVGLEVPELSLPSSDGQPFSLRSQVGRGPLLLFFYIRNGTPG